MGLRTVSSIREAFGTPRLLKGMMGSGILSRPLRKCDPISLAGGQRRENRDGNSTTTETRTLARSKSATRTAENRKGFWTKDDGPK
jgi:cysteine sulfinate desulfinase/cysteine desulfurase-like protein